MTVSLIPESAPFTGEQRAWLNGFFAGLLNFADGAQELPGVALQTLTSTDFKTAPAESAAEDFPWHDPSLSLDERLALAESKPLERKLMAAMAQLDCGACGYLCQTYSEAIARGDEKDLARCSPGGKPTAKKLKELMASASAESPIKPATVNGNGALLHQEVTPSAPAAGPAYTRQNPFHGRLLQNACLNGPGSAKDTRLISIDLTGSDIAYLPGDSLGVWPVNCSDLVDDVLGRLHATGDEEVPTPDGRHIQLRQALLNVYDISRPSDALVELLAKRASNPGEAQASKELVDGNEGGYLEDADIVDVLTRFGSAELQPEEFVNVLSSLQPRLYSISSSQAAFPNEVHLTVGVVRYQHGARDRKGVCSTFLAERLQPGDAVPVYLQPSHGFRLPAETSIPIIMIGPGTGIAPFRAFLQERNATGARGLNWLVFGDQHGETDFLYRDELLTYKASGLLTRLDCAFSRDQAEKLYVQHRLLENAADVWAWIQQGAYIYICGDARRMARDVDQALQQIVADQGSMRPADAKAFVQQLAKAKRYQRDVY